MAYDEGLAERMRVALRENPEVDERHMFGGIAFMLHGYMFVGIVGETLMVRVGPAAYTQALGQRHVRPMDFTGKPLTGYVYVDPPGFEDDADLARWIGIGRDFVTAMPPKPPKLPRKKPVKR